MQIILPYVGSKKRIFEAIKLNLPETSLYVEPFSGGFSLGMDLLESGQVEKAHINDINKGVYSFWSSVKNTPLDLYSSIKDSNFTGKYFEDSDMEKMSMLELASLEYVARSVNSGMFRRRTTSLFTPKYRLRDLFFKASYLLSDSTVSNCSYEDLKYLDSETTFWYLDPPYYGHSNEVFYGHKNTNGFDHVELVSFLKTLKGKFILSDTNCGYTRDLYSDFNVYEVYLFNKLNGSYTQELFVSNFPLTIQNEFTLKSEFERGLAKVTRQKEQWEIDRLLHPRRSYVKIEDDSLNTVDLFD